MPPAIRTTSSPTAQMTLTALLFINDAKFPALKKGRRGEAQIQRQGRQDDEQARLALVGP